MKSDKAHLQWPNESKQENQRISWPLSDSSRRERGEIINKPSDGLGPHIWGNESIGPSRNSLPGILSQIIIPTEVENEIGVENVVDQLHWTTVGRWSWGRAVWDASGNIANGSGALFLLLRRQRFLRLSPPSGSQITNHKHTFPEEACYQIKEQKPIL